MTTIMLDIINLMTRCVVVVVVVVVVYIMFSQDI